jgi:hypothetical protein
MAINFDKSLASVLSGDAVIPANTYGALVAHVVATVDKSETVTGALAYGVRRNGIAGVETAQTMTRLAQDLITDADVASAPGETADAKRVKATERKRVSLAQWATAYGYLVETETPVTGETYRDARRIYNGGKASRERFDALKSAVLATDETGRIGAFRAAANECAALKSVKAPNTPAPGNGENTDESESETRAPRLGSENDDVQGRTLAWVSDFKALVKRAGEPGLPTIVLSDAQREEIEDVWAIFQATAVSTEPVAV